MIVPAERIEALRRIADRTAPPAAGDLVGGNDRRRRLMFTSAAEIAPERTRWLWAGRVPIGSVSLLAGRQGLGKSTLTAELAARLSRGELEGDLQGEPGSTLIVSYEDHAGNTIVPRLIAAGADLDMVRIVGIEGERDLVSLPADIDEIAAGAYEHAARLLIVDPVVASLPADVNSHRDQDVRRALAPLAKLAEDHDLSVLGLIHWNKAPGTDALLRVGGSTAFTAGPRSVLAFGHDRDEPDGPGRVLAHAKCNLAPLAPSLACRIEGRQVHHEGEETIETVQLVMLGECSASAADLLVSTGEDERSEIDEACDFLADHLADGAWHPKKETEAAAKQDGHAPRTLRRAVKKLGVESERQGFPARASWRLPVGPTPLGPTGTEDPWPNCENPAVEPKTGPPTPQLGQARNVGLTGSHELASAGSSTGDDVLIEQVLDLSAGAVNTDAECDALYDRLEAAGFAPEWITGDLPTTGGTEGQTR